MDRRAQSQPTPEAAPSGPPVVNAPGRQAGERAITLLGWIATATAVIMYVSYISQIQLNLTGHKG